MYLYIWKTYKNETNKLVFLKQKFSLQDVNAIAKCNLI